VDLKYSCLSFYIFKDFEALYFISLEKYT